MRIRVLDNALWGVIGLRCNTDLGIHTTRQYAIVLQPRFHKKDLLKRRLRVFIAKYDHFVGCRKMRHVRFYSFLQPVGQHFPQLSLWDIVGMAEGESDSVARDHDKHLYGNKK